MSKLQKPLKTQIEIIEEKFLSPEKQKQKQLERDKHNAKLAKKKEKEMIQESLRSKYGQVIYSAKELERMEKSQKKMKKS